MELILDAFTPIPFFMSFQQGWISVPYKMIIFKQLDALTIWWLGNICLGRFAWFALPCIIVRHNPEAVLWLLPQLVHNETGLPEWDPIDWYPASRADVALLQNVAGDRAASVWDGLCPGDRHGCGLHVADIGCTWRGWDSWHREEIGINMIEIFLNMPRTNLMGMYRKTWTWTCPIYVQSNRWQYYHLIANLF